MKGILPKSRFALLKNQSATGAAGSDLLTGEIDAGGAKNGTLILVVDNAASSDQANVEIWTSRASNFATSGTALAAVTSDSTALVLITSDTSNFYAQGLLGATISDVAINSSVVSNLTEDGMYVFNVKSCARYINVQYDSDGTGSKITALFIGHDLDKAPWPGARTAY